ncbi:CPBP family intramembrane metalloprotease [Streptococcus sanguinis]|uniref:CPBP family intramembrane glutamic endopeptidase n=1 Tax=Streptococcus sanguinis TaxID=1305 RepID=UPI001CBF2C5A|nr:CPBP family intramembrane glutamic endopeptidase [Streptococcus sanguinis]MBZ2037973.1 CPBP family intramembrane metalloprotease [Streptococcus sanguinis]MBZ2071369.1 CPBP family intramembrane metalloprotease [Streptococcus sanguinis]
MKLLTNLRPSKPLKQLKWFDIAVVTLLLFGQFIYRSTELFLASLAPAAATAASAAADSSTTAASDGAAYSSNLTFQLIMLALTIAYLLLRHFDFKQLPVRLTWSVLFWVPFIFALVGIFGDIVTSLSGEYNYFDPALWSYIDPLEIFRKLADLTPMAILYGLLNGFYEEFFFLGLMTSINDKYKWWALLYSTIIRISFHTYQGMLWALVIGVVYGLFYYFLYKYKVKNLLPFFLMHALADMFGSSLMYVLINWRS